MTTPPDSSSALEPFREPLRRFLAKRLPSEADAADLLQDVFLRISERRDELAAVDHLRGYLHKVARGVLVDYYREAGRREAALAALGDDDGSASTEADAGRELAACLVPIVERLDEPYREAIVLTELEGLTQAEAARRVGLTLPGMKSRVQRGREMLRALVLSCCEVELDRRRGVTTFASRRGNCGCSQ